MTHDTVIFSEQRIQG